MPGKQSHNNSLPDKEVLSARIEVKEHFVNAAVRTIYDNVAQSLSLLMVNLSLLQIKRITCSDAQIDDSKRILGQSIRDLRRMAAELSPEFNLTTIAGFSRMVENEIKHVFPGSGWKGPEHDNGKNWVQQDRLIMTFSMILKLVGVFADQSSSVVKAVAMEFHQSDLSFAIESDKKFKYRLPEILVKRMRAINGRIEQLASDALSQSVILHIPLNR
jgi:hypothetical protein